MVPNRAGLCAVPQSVPFPDSGKHPVVVGSFWCASWQACSAMPICLRLFWLWLRAAASRIF